MNFLFICSRNKWRSRTAETIFKNQATHSVKSAGMAPSARIKISKELIAWADVIFVMEKHHREEMESKFHGEIQNKKIIVLDIPDDYTYMHPELIDMLRLEAGPYF